MKFASPPDIARGGADPYPVMGSPFLPLSLSLCDLHLPCHVLERDTSFGYRAYWEGRKYEGQELATQLYTSRMEMSVMCQQRLSFIRDEGETGLWASLPSRNSIKAQHPHTDIREGPQHHFRHRSHLHFTSVTKAVPRLPPKPCNPASSTPDPWGYGGGLPSCNSE